MKSRTRIGGAAAVVLGCAVWALVPDPVPARAGAIAVAALVLWLSESVPAFVPTLLLLCLVPLLLSGHGEMFGIGAVLKWVADPVLPLFFGGFALATAASRYGLDQAVASLAIKRSVGRRVVLIALVTAATAFLSMWMSNIAAAAMMFAAVRPIFASTPRDDRFRRAVLVAIALGADLGGIGTPIGSGPNGIAISHAAHYRPITFIGWMTFALPLVIGLLSIAVLLVIYRFRTAGTASFPLLNRPELDGSGRQVVVLFAMTIVAWLTEPFHGIPAAVVSLLTTTILFGTRLLQPADLARIDWSTILLIAGGIGLGRLLDQSGILATLSAIVPWATMPELVRTFILCLASATLASLMSNTGTVAMLVPLAATIDPGPATAILVAIAASLGVPLVISTPPNAMAVGEGGLSAADLAVPGVILLVGGCLVLALTGRYVLSLAGIP